MSLGKGVAKELRLARRALATARGHIKNARCGLYADDDTKALRVLIELCELRVELGGLTKRKVQGPQKRAA